MYFLSKKIAMALALGVVSSLHAAYKGAFEKVRDRTGALVELRLPFPYQHLTTSPETGLPIEGVKDKDGNLFTESTVFIPEMFYAVLDGGSKIRSAVVGPCSPCAAIAVRDARRDKTIVMHAQISPFITPLFEAILAELGSNVGDIRVKIFTSTTFRTDEKSRDRIEGQKVFLKNLEQVFVYRFNVPKKNIEQFCYEQVNTNFFFLQAADVTVFVDKDLNFKTTCSLNESLFLRDIPAGRMEAVYETGEFYKNILLFYMGAFVPKDTLGNPMGPVSLDDITLENAVKQGGFPFFRICDSAAGLAELSILASGKKFCSTDAIEQLTEEERKIVAAYCKKKKIVEELISMGSLKEDNLGKLILNKELLGIKECT